MDSTRLADSPHHRVENWKFKIVVVIYYVFVNILDSKLNLENETYRRGIYRSPVRCWVCPGDDFIGDEVFIQTEVSDTALDKGKIDNDLLGVVNLEDIKDQSNENTIVKDTAIDIIGVGGTSRNVPGEEAAQLPTTSSFPSLVATIFYF